MPSRVFCETLGKIVMALFEISYVKSEDYSHILPKAYCGDLRDQCMEKV